MGSFNLASKGHKDSQGIICIRVSHRVGVRWNTVALYSHGMYAPTNILRRPRFQSSAMIFRKPPSAPFDFYLFVSPRTKRIPFFSKGKGKIKRGIPSYAAPTQLSPNEAWEIVALYPFLASAHHFFEATEPVSRWSWIITSSAENRKAPRRRRRRGARIFFPFLARQKGGGLGYLSMNSQIRTQAESKNSGPWPVTVTVRYESHCAVYPKLNGYTYGDV
jgi:hypothetical protein